MKKSYRFEFSRPAEKEFAGLPRILQSRILKKLEYFERADDPLFFAKKLIGTEDKFRFRIGDYRIIVSKIDKNIFVVLLMLKIAHRKDVYT